MASKKIATNKTKKSLKKKLLGGILQQNQLDFLGANNQSNLDKYVILSCPEFEYLAENLIRKSDGLFIKGNLTWHEYTDGTPNMFLDEYTVKMLRNRNVIYLAYFSFNEPKSTNILSQYMLLSSLASYGINKLHIILPYYPTGTMERIVMEGELGTGYYLAHFFNSIPCGNSKNELYVIDMHALCTRFFFHTNIKMTFITMFYDYVRIMKKEPDTSFVVFPDDGAEKRNKKLCELNDVKFITCAKKRNKDERHITITGSLDEVKQSLLTNLQKKRSRQDFKVTNLYIMDDLIQTGGTVGTVISQLDTALNNELNDLLAKNSEEAVIEEERFKIIKYILLITHSILPPPLKLPENRHQTPLIDTVRNIFCSKLHFDKMPNIVYISTDTRPIMRDILDELNRNDDLLRDRINTIPIDDALISVFTDINSPYITPYK
jgi:phosphoribosylpyrophosphate synthetase